MVPGGQATIQAGFLEAAGNRVLPNLLKQRSHFLIFAVTGLPSFLQVAVYLDPLTYGVDALRQVILGHGALPLYISTAVVVGFALLTIILSATLFSKREQNLM